MADLTYRTRLEKLRRAAQVAAGRNPRDLGVLTGALIPAITTPGAHGLTSPKQFLLRSADGNSLLGQHPFDIAGGFPYLNPGSGQVTFVAWRSPPGTASNISTPLGYNGASWRVGTVTDSANFVWTLLGYATYRVLVDLFDGQGLRYVSKNTTASASSGGIQYLKLVFPAVAAANGEGNAPSGRRAKLVVLEGTGNAAITGCLVDNQASCWKPMPQQRVKGVIIGDSLAAGTGCAFVADGWAAQFADMAGWDDLRNPSIGGVGYMANGGGTQWKYLDHRIDWLSQTDADVFVFTGGNNDIGNADQSALAHNMRHTFRITREAFPDTPIIVFGPDSTPDYSNAIATEQALRLAAAEANIPAGAFIPLIQYAEGIGTQSDRGSELFGTGNVTAPNGTGNSDFYQGNTLSGNDVVHPNFEGHTYRARNRVRRYRAALETI